MGTIANLNRRVQTLNFRKITEESVRLTAFDILTINKEQLSDGFNAKGEKITPKYNSPIYAIDKQKLNPLAGFMTPDLKLTGAFYEGLNITLGNYSFTIDSSDSKGPELEAKYSKYIYGLSPQSKRKYVPILYKKIIGSIKQQTGL